MQQGWQRPTERLSHSAGPIEESRPKGARDGFVSALLCGINSASTHIKHHRTTCTHPTHSIYVQNMHVHAGNFLLKIDLTIEPNCSLTQSQLWHEADAKVESKGPIALRPDVLARTSRCWWTKCRCPTSQNEDIEHPYT